MHTESQGRVHSFGPIEATVNTKLDTLPTNDFTCESVTGTVAQKYVLI